MRYFEQELQQQAEERTVTQNQRVDDLGSTDLSTSSFSSSLDFKHEQNIRDRDSEDPEATTSKKKSKIDEDIVNGNETVKEEENVNELCNNCITSIQNIGK